jgi:single-strand DNA-binding protein
VRLRGRLSRDPEIRVLPSGDEVVLLRVVVRRPDGEREDSLPVAVGPPPPVRKRRRPGQAARTTVSRASGLSAGARVEVEGWMQRRFWSGEGGRRLSRVQVVATEIRRIGDGPDSS